MTLLGLGRPGAQRALAWALGTSALAVLLAGCSSSGNGAAAASAAVPSLTATASVTVSTDLALPIQAYLLSRTQLQLIAQAQQRLTAECMRQFGFVLPDPSPADGGGRYTGPVTDTDRRYGITDAADPQRYGYHLPPDQDPANFRRPTLPPESPAELMVLSGVSGTTPVTPGQQFNGRPVPLGGCVGQAQREISPGGPAFDANLAQNINDESFSQSRTDPRVTAVFHRWSACMAAKGFDFPDPLAAGNAFTGPAPTPLEIATATADVECKDQTNLVGIWYSVDVAYQNQLIEQNAQQLAQVRQNDDVQVRNATRIIGAGG